MKFLSLKIFFMHFENCTDSVVRNTDVFLHECDFALMQIESKYDMERSWDKKKFEEVSTKTISGVPVRGFQTQYLYSRS